MDVFIYYEDLDNSCSDDDCCGGPYPQPNIKIFSTKEAAIKAGYKVKDLKLVTVDEDQFTRLG